MASRRETGRLPVLYLCGAGNPDGVRLALRLNEDGQRWSRIALLDDDPATHGSVRVGVTVEGPVSLLEEVTPGEGEVVNLVARTTVGRRNVRRRLEAFGHPLVGLVSPDVDLMGAIVAQDVLVYPNATVGAEATVASGCVVFMGAVVGHESVVGEGCVVASNAVINARVHLGAESYVGTNATILPEVHVGIGVTVGAGSVVVSDVEDGTSVMGVPAQPLKPAPSLRPKGGVEQAPTSRGHALPADAAVEEEIVQAWQAILGDDPFDRDSNFFDVGGTSLLALHLHEELRDRTGADISVVDIFRFPTIRALALHLAGQHGRAGPEPELKPTRPTLNTGPRAVPEGYSSDEDLDCRVTEVFREVLGIPDLSADDDFFAAGGDGRAAHDASVELQRATGLQLCFMHIVQFPTAKRLASACNERSLDPACPARSIISRRVARQTASTMPT